MKKIFCVFISIIIVCLCAACSNNPNGNGGNGGNNSNKNNSEKYANIQRIVEAYKDVYIFQNYNGEYGLLSADGDILREGLDVHQPFSEFSNYISCYDGSSSMNSNVSFIVCIHSARDAVFAGFRKGFAGCPCLPYSRILAIFALLPPSERGSAKPTLMS